NEDQEDGLLVEGMSLDGAYRTLGVTPDASAHAIKEAHQKLVKRWHPDFYRTGTTEHSEASQMTRLLNEAFSTITHALLSDQLGAWHCDHPAKPTCGARSESSSATPQRKQEPGFDQIEFWVRFLLGAMLGLFVALDATLSNLAISLDISSKVWLAME